MTANAANRRWFQEKSPGLQKKRMDKRVVK